VSVFMGSLWRFASPPGPLSGGEGEPKQRCTKVAFGLTWLK
jgi:hypothetical protein